MHNIRIKSIIELLEELISEKIEISDVLNEEIKNIAEYNKRLNAFITIFDEDSIHEISRIKGMGEAKTFIEKKSYETLKSTQNSDFSLFGIPLTVKDNIFIGGRRTTAGSKAFQKFVPAVNAEVVDNILLKGCLPLGKTNLHELAMGATSSSSFFGPVRNPVDSSRISGGSGGRPAVCGA